MQPRELYKTQQYATAIYQSELAIRLKELGYNLESGKNGAPEIKGYSAEYIAFNSARRQQIQDHLQQGGYRGAAAAQIAAHRTRGGKHLGEATRRKQLT
jgi:conjugative relaxase-like TrwC/TraI family protein